jgi:hypothetical protein
MAEPPYIIKLKVRQRLDRYFGGECSSVDKALHRTVTHQDHKWALPSQYLPH